MRSDPSHGRSHAAPTQCLRRVCGKPPLRCLWEPASHYHCIQSFVCAACRQGVNQSTRTPISLFSSSLFYFVSVFADVAFVRFLFTSRLDLAEPRRFSFQAKHFALPSPSCVAMPLPAFDRNVTSPRSLQGVLTMFRLVFSRGHAQPSLFAGVHKEVLWVLEVHQQPA